MQKEHNDESNLSRTDQIRTERNETNTKQHKYSNRNRTDKNIRKRYRTQQKKNR